MDCFRRQMERNCEGATFFGRTLKAAYRIDAHTQAGDVCIVSDGSETQRDSEIRYNNLFIGEVIDYTCAFQMEKPVSVLPAPKAELSPAIGTPDRLIRTLQPVFLHERDGKRIFDAGENVTGFVRLKTAARVAQTYERLGHFDTGFVGTDILLEVLFDHGFGSTALRLLESRELGSFLNI